MALRDVFVIREGKVIDFTKERDKRVLPIGQYVDKYADEISAEKLSFEDYAEGPFPYEDYSPEQKVAFRQFYLQKYPDRRPLNADGWNALHDEFDSRPSLSRTSAGSRMGDVVPFRRPPLKSK